MPIISSYSSFSSNSKNILLTANFSIPVVIGDIAIPIKYSIVYYQGRD
jgi:hypothetical protein